MRDVEDEKRNLMTKNLSNRMWVMGFVAMWMVVIIHFSFISGGGELYVCSRCVDAMGSAVVFLCEWHVCGAIFGKRWLVEVCYQKVLGIGCSVCNLDSGADVGGR